MNKMLHIALSSALVMGVAHSAYAIDLKTTKHKTGYAIGVNMASNLKKIAADIDVDALLAGLKAGIKGEKLQMTDAEMQSELTAFQNVITEKRKKEADQQAAKRKEAAPQNIAEGKKFLAENKKKKGVITTKSGLQYKIIKSGEGKVSPKLTDTVTTHYSGKLINGTEFDSSYKRNKPTSFPVNGVIKGWTEALQLMKAGDKWKLYIPSDLAYGENGAGAAIAPGATLIFDIELIKIGS